MSRRRSHRATPHRVHSVHPRTVQQPRVSRELGRPILVLRHTTGTASIVDTGTQTSQAL